MQVVCIIRTLHHYIASNLQYSTITYMTRTNIYRSKIISLLKRVHLLSISDISGKLSMGNFSTIFRNVEQLCKDGVIRKVTISKDLILYEFIHENHHDHFVCNDCGTIESINLKNPIVLKGNAVSYDVMIRGICEKCIHGEITYTDLPI